MSDFVGMNECSNCGALYPHHTSHTCPYRPAETFPRPPSNEQTLLTELGEAKARCETACDKVTQLSLELERAQVQRNAHCDEEDALTDLMAKQDEQIKRLRESLVAVIAESDRASVAYDKAKAILKETAP